ncbi:TPA: hypothetical protein N0F65_007326 [Lagenidium giganteum]|uniref:G domain-containing protein n=1 Tax=Lagenidium giganteum TaxID=4803 RepID=A0AAV2Z795_9STRA|nr:TPA: hypothetical protein N0F65_007326 [Lagenidium giganteum]
MIRTLRASCAGARVAAKRANTVQRSLQTQALLRTSARSLSALDAPTRWPTTTRRSVHTSSTCCASTGKDQHQHKQPLPMDRVLNHLELMEHWACSGCGIELQYAEPKKVGYLPKELLGAIHDTRELKKLRCERCFQMTQYGKIVDAKMPYHEYEKRVKALHTQDLLMIQLVDILDISGSLLPKARHIFGKKPVMLVVNKGDLIPEQSGVRRLMRRIQQEAKDVGIENVVAIYLVSAMKGIGMREIIEDVKKHRKGRDICVVGAANVGKSTFLNSFMQYLSDRKWIHNHRRYMRLPEVSLDDLNEDDTMALLNSDDEHILEATQSKEEGADEQASITPSGLYMKRGEDPTMLEECEDEDRAVTTSPLPGTTLAVQCLPVMAKNELYNILDTPGLIADSKRQKLVEVLALDGAAKLRDVFPTKQLPMTVYRMDSGRCLFLGALARFDYEWMGPEADKDKNMLLFSWFGVLPGHQSKTAAAEETYVKHAGGLLSPPRGLDALSFTGPLVHTLDVHLKDYITEDIRKKSKNPKKPKRTSVVELELPGFGWLTVTAVDLDGTGAAERTLEKAKISISVCNGVSVVPRVPLFPFEMSKSKSSSWKS